MEHIKTYDELTFTDDFMFCKVMTTYEDICQELTGRILGHPVRIVKKPEPQKTITLSADGKGIRFDVFFEDDSETQYDVEMQTTKMADLGKRSRYYQAAMDINSLKSGVSYRNLKNSFIIFICTFDPYKKGHYRYTFSGRSDEFSDVTANDGATRVFINTKGADTAPGTLRPVLDYLNGVLSDEALVERMENAVHESYHQEHWRLEYMTLLERDEQKRQEGFDRGISIGRTEGISIGRTEGLSEALKALMEDSGFSLETAMKMLRIPQTDRSLYAHSDGKRTE